MGLRRRWGTLRTKRPKVPPFRLGIWCDYHYGRTLIPYGSVGVLVHNLVEGIFQLEEPVEIVLLIRPGEEHLASRLKALGGNGLHFIPEVPRPTFLQRALGRAIQGMDKARSAKERLRDVVLAKAAVLAENGKRMVGRWFKRALEGNWAVAGLLVAVLPVVFILTWGGYSLVQLVKAFFKAAMFPVHFLDRLIRRLQKHGQEGSAVKTSLEAAQDAHCDVWLIPWSAFADPLPIPSVLYIHDLVATRHPEWFSADFVEFFNRVTPSRAAEATLCACMSEFNRDHDLLGILDLPPAKVRIVRPAPPRDFPPMSRDQAQALKPAHLNRPYLFMPNAICPAKNQQALIEALRLLRDQFGEDRWDVVFAGDPGYLGDQLHQLVTQHRLEGRVHFVGMVDREMLAALFSCAWATIVPTLYERGSFPVLEALHWDCPVACSDLPALREQFASMGEAMMYFDPRKPEDLARTILRIRDDREKIRLQQKAASRILRERSWQDVARDWLVVFKEAAAIARQSSRQLPGVRPAA